MRPDYNHTAVGARAPDHFHPDDTGYAALADDFKAKPRIKVDVGSQTFTALAQELDGAARTESRRVLSR